MWYFYIRMSHEASAASGISEVAQIHACNAYYKEIAKGFPDPTISPNHFPDDAPPGCFIDRAQSAWEKGFWGLDQRPAGKEIFKHLKKGDHIVVYNVERFARNTENCVRMLRELEERGINVHFTIERIDFTTAAGRMMLSILSAVAQYQSDISSERIREALRIKKLFQQQTKQKRDNSEWLDSDLPVNLPSKQPPPIQGFTVHIYNRVSSFDQKLSGLGMEVQREANLLKAQSIAKNGEDIKVYEDHSVSAFSVPFTKRPAASKLLAALKPGDHVVIYRGDRAFRNARQCCEFVENCMTNNVIVHLTKEGANTGDEYGRLFFRILAIFAEIESEIKRRQKNQINAFLAARGRPICSAPRQYKVRKVNGKKQLTYDFDELKQMCRAWLLRKMGYEWPQIQRTLQAYYCQDKKIKPKLICEFKDAKTRRRAKRFTEILPKLGAEVTSGLIADAVSHLSRPIAETYLSWCAHPLPVQCTWDRLVALGIDPTILSSLPDAPGDHAQSQAG